MALMFVVVVDVIVDLVVLPSCSVLLIVQVVLLLLPAVLVRLLRHVHRIVRSPCSCSLVA